MSYPPGSWPPWLQPSSLHSPIDIEHRLTSLEAIAEHHGDLHEERESSHKTLEKRIALHEKAILVILGALNVLLQDKYPALAGMIRGFLP